MSEPKLCPFFVLYAQLKDTDVLKDAKTLSFYGCLAGKCALWLEENQIEDEHGFFTGAKELAHCGLVGK